MVFDLEQMRQNSITSLQRFNDAPGRANTFVKNDKSVSAFDTAARKAVPVAPIVETAPQIAALHRLEVAQGESHEASETQ